MVTNIYVIHDRDTLINRSIIMNGVGYDMVIICVKLCIVNIERVIKLSLLFRPGFAVSAGRMAVAMRYQ